MSKVKLAFINNHPKRSLFLAFTLSLGASLGAGCATNSDAATTPGREKPVDTRIYPLNDSNTLRHFPVDDPDNENVRETCCRDGECVEPKAFVTKILAFLPVDKLADKLFGAIANEIDQELQNYLSDYSVTSLVHPFYGSAPPDVANRCFRVVRGELKEGVDPAQQTEKIEDHFAKVHTDHTFAMVFDKDQAMLKTWLVRAALYETETESRERETDRGVIQPIAMTIQVKLSSRWVEAPNFETFTKEETVTLNSVAFDLSSDENRVQYFAPCDPGQPRSRQTRCVIPKTMAVVPVSNIDWVGDKGHASITVSVSEVGNAPKLLKKLKAFFGKEDELGKKAAESLQELINEGLKKLDE